MNLASPLRLLLTLGPLGVTACPVISANLPAITETPTGDRQPGGIIWRDLLTNDPQASQRFYGALFGWEFESVGLASNLSGDSDYTLVRHEGRLIGGIMPSPLEGLDPVWVSYPRTEDPMAIVERVPGMGGRVIVSATTRPVGGTVAFVAGPSGAGIALQSWPLEERQAEMQRWVKCYDAQPGRLWY